MAGTLTHLSGLHIRDSDSNAEGPLFNGTHTQYPPGNTTLTAAEGSDQSYTTKVFNKAAIVNNTATTLFTITIPNVTTACMLIVRTLAHFDASPINDSSVGVMNMIVVTRRAGVAAVAAITPFVYSATNPVTNVNQLVNGTIATLAAGATLTSILSLGSVTGGATATETVTVQITNAASAGTPTSSTQTVVEIQVSCPGVAAGGGITIA